MIGRARGRMADSGPRDRTRRMRRGLPIVCALVGLLAAPARADLMFARDSAVPPAVQDFAWRAIESRCDYQQHERTQRSFWVYRTRLDRAGGASIYSIQIASDLPWRKIEPTAFIDMTLVDDGRLRLTALTSTFITCTP